MPRGPQGGGASAHLQQRWRSTRPRQGRAQADARPSCGRALAVARPHAGGRAQATAGGSSGHGPDPAPSSWIRPSLRHRVWRRRGPGEGELRRRRGTTPASEHRRWRGPTRASAGVNAAPRWRTSTGGDAGTPGCRARQHGTARFTADRAVHGPRSRYGGTVRHGTVKPPCRIVPCLTVLVLVQCRAARLAMYTSRDGSGRAGIHHSRHKT